MTARYWRKRLTGVDPLDFSSGLLRIQAQPPTPFARTLLYSLLTMLGLLFIWAVFGRLDVVASAEGKLLPQSYLKIVQPSEQGVIRDILEEEGQHVTAEIHLGSRTILEYLLSPVLGAFQEAGRER